MRHGDGAADEHRGRGGGDGGQDGPQVGLPRQGRARRPGEDHRRRRQLPRPYDHDRQLLHRPRGPGGLRPVHPRVRDRPLRRPRRDGGRGRRRHRGGAASSRSRARRGAGPPPGYLAGVRRADPRARTCSSSRTRSSRAWAVRAAPSRASTRACVPDMYVLGKALGGGVVPVSAVGRPPARARGLPAGRARVHLRREPAGVRGRPWRWSRCCGPGSTSSGRPSWATTCTASWPLAGERRRSQRYAAAACGRASTSTPPSARAGTLTETPAGPRRPGQGHPRLHDPAGAAPDDHQGGPGLVPGPAPQGPVGLGAVGGLPAADPREAVAGRSGRTALFAGRGLRADRVEFRDRVGGEAEGRRGDVLVQVGHR